MTKHRQKPVSRENARQSWTVKDVAERAGVSTATVSRVISGKGGVSPKLEEKVKATIQALDYRPNRAARRLRERKTKIIGVILPDIQNPFFTSMVVGIEEVLREKGYLLLLGNSSENPQRELEQINILLAEDVSGIIFATTMEDLSVYHRIQLSGLPLVAIDRKPGGLEVDLVQVDNISAASQAVRHFFALGHRRIGLISGPNNIYTGIERRLGYQQALIEAGFPLETDLVQIADYRQEGGYRAMGCLLDLDLPPTAVLVANNLMTLGALQMIHERGVEIPDQLALIGFDDMPWATSLHPPLTVIAQPVYQMGVVTARLLLERIDNPQAAVKTVALATELIVRASCGSAPARQ